MFFLVAIFAATLSLSIANPVSVMSVRQIPNFQCIDPSVTLPTRCLDALNDYIRMVNMTISPGTGLTPAVLSRLADLAQSALGVLCSSDCLNSFIRCNGNSELVRNLTTQINCVRAEDGKYCPAKWLQVQSQRPEGVLIPADCAATAVSTTCSSSCQQTYRQLRDDLGCCAATFFTNPATPLQQFGRNFATCGVPLGNPCSGAAIIYLNLVLVLAMVLVSLAMV